MKYFRDESKEVTKKRSLREASFSWICCTAVTVKCPADRDMMLAVWELS